MSIHAINKSTDKDSGGGLPVYDKLDYIFSKLNKGFNGSLGLWQTPNNKIPSFQFFLSGDFDTVISFVYHETKGENNFTGTTYVVNPANLHVHAGTKDGAQGYWMHTTQAQAFPLPPDNGRWIIFLVISDGVTEQTYYTEEFLTQPCCQT
jgi:hypothetical protein